MRKKLVLVLALVLLMSIPISVYALDTAGMKNDLYEVGITYSEVALQFPELINVAVASGGQPELQSEKEINLGKEIKTYGFDETGNIIDVEFKFYPVFVDDDIVGLVTARITENSEVFLEYSNILVDEIGEYYKENKELCLLVNDNSLWVADKDGTRIVNYNSYSSNDKRSSNIPNRTDIKNKLELLTKGDMVVKVSEQVSTRSTVITGSDVMSVPVELQATGSQYCWACAAVSIGDYKVPSINLEPEDVAIEYAGDLDTPKSITTIKSVLSNEYGLSSSYKNQYLRMSVVQDNTYYDTPIAAYVTYGVGDGGHFIVVRGYNVQSTSTTGTQYVYIMDSLAGYRTLRVPSDGSLDRELKYYKTSDVNSNTPYRITMYLELN